jgi:ankyrin repeat protein
MFALLQHLQLPPQNQGGKEERAAPEGCSLSRASSEATASTSSTAQTARSSTSAAAAAAAAITSAGNPVSEFIRRGQSVDAVDLLLQLMPQLLKARDGPSGDLPLHAAAAAHATASADLVRLLLRGWEDAAREANASGCLPLHLAASSSSSQPGASSSTTVLELLVGAHPQALLQGDGDGWVPLHRAVIAAGAASPSTRSDQAVKFLAGACPEACRQRDNDGWLPMHYAAVLEGGRSLPVLQVLYDAYPEALEDATGDFGSLPLHLAAWKCASAEAVEFLLQKSPPAALRTRNAAGMLPLHEAADGSPSPRAVRLVCRAWAGALGEPDADGNLPLHLAAARGEPRLDVVELLAREAGGGPAALLQANERGERPVDLARGALRARRGTSSRGLSDNAAGGAAGQQATDDDDSEAAAVVAFLERATKEARASPS